MAANPYRLLTHRLQELAHDLRVGIRILRRTPADSGLAVLTIAVGLGANAAVFALVNTLFFRPLPFDPDGRLVRVHESRVAPDGGPQLVTASRRTADAIAERRDLFAASVAMAGSTAALDRDDGALHVRAARVGPAFTRVLGIAPILGRSFTPDEEQAGDAGSAVLISHRLWRSQFGEPPNIVGRAFRLDGRSFVVAGVLQPGFHVPYESDVWFPARFEEDERSLFILARLAPGVSLAQANGELEAIGRRLNDLYPSVMRQLGVTAVRARDTFVGSNDRVALALMGAVSFLLLIGCANLAVLMSVRIAARQREVGIRAALGCGRGRQVRQFLTEGLVLFLLGGALGLLIAVWLKDSLWAFMPEALATDVGIERLALDWRVVGFTGVLAVGCGLAFGLLAAIRGTRGDLVAVTKEGDRSMTARRTRGPLRGLVVAEVALALVLLSAGGIMLDTFQRLHRRDLGFDPTGVLTVQADLHAERYREPAPRAAFIRDVLSRLEGMPGVRHAGVTTVNPLCCGDWGALVTVEGHVPGPDVPHPIVQHQLVSPGYFETMRMRLIEGRAFSLGDRDGRQPVAIVDERLAQRYWPGGSALGKRIKRGTPDSEHPWATIVGVVDPIEDEGEYAESWYLPYLQHATGPSSGTLHLMVRADDDPLALAAPIRTTVAELDAGLALHDVTTMDRVRSDRLRQHRLGAFVTALFSGVGVLLAGLGLYAVLAFLVASETREIGIRVALGAQRVALARAVVGRGMRLVGWGILVGSLGAVAAAAGLQQIVPEARFDARIVVTAGSILTAVACLATTVPAHRALRLNPLDALRAD